MKKMLIGGAVAAAMFGGAALGPAIATAQEETGETNTTSDYQFGDGSEAGHRHGHRGQHGPGRGAHLAETLGIEVDVLKEGREAGQTLAETLEANGISVEQATAALLEQVESRLSEAVEAGRLSADEAQEKLADAPERIESMLNRDPSEGPVRDGQGRKGKRGGHGMRHNGHNGEA